MEMFVEPPPQRPALPVWLRLLPLLLIAVLVALGSAVEAIRFGALLWSSKLPIVLLLAWAAVRITVWRRYPRNSAS
ncbi:MAG TPA: hypothetical protein VGS57_00945 [Thermoanaerobaculia bacterium]|jgi:hypothetical protein|nr:hypothetical protein [Thermoanaerobaculia bacterium]